MFKNKCKHLYLYQIIKNGNKTVGKNNNPTLYDYSRIIQFNHSYYDLQKIYFASLETCIL